MGLFFHIDLFIYSGQNSQMEIIPFCYNQDQSKEDQKCSLIREESKSAVKIYLNSDGLYDALYNKEYIRDSGVCQSLLYEVTHKNISFIPQIDLRIGSASQKTG